MRSRQGPLDALASLPTTKDESERRARWRQAVARLGETEREQGAPPLEGLATEQLTQAVRTALECGLVDDLGWMPPERAAVALYELSSAMPAGELRTAMGRRVFTRIREGTAATFAAVATRMAVVSPKPLSTPALRARVNLLFSLPAGTNVKADALALSLLARRDLFTSWVEVPSSDTLPARRLAARVLERASVEIVRRTQRGDPGALTCFHRSAVQAVYQRLLADREPLVWKHAAVARGILSAVVPELRQEIDLQLGPALSPTEWRRAAVSLAACLVSDPITAMQQCKSLLRSDLFEKHPSILSTLLWGLEPVIDVDPDLAQELINFVSWVDRTDIAQNLARLLQEVHIRDFGKAAARRVREGLIERSQQGGDPEQVLLRTLAEEMHPAPGDPSISQTLRSALGAFVTTGAHAAHELANEALKMSLQAVEELEGGATDKVRPFHLLRDIDVGALESARLYDLLLLGRRPSDTNASVVEVERLYDRLGSWLLSSATKRPAKEADDEELAVRQQSWLSLLHLMDVETSSRSGSEHGAERIAWRIRRSIHQLLGQLRAGNEPELHRVFCATLARSFDAAVREGVADVGDILLVCMRSISDPASIVAVVDASTTEDSRHALQAYARFLSLTGRTPDSDGPISRFPEPRSQLILRLASGLHLDATYRGEAVRQTLLALARCVRALESAVCLRDLLEESDSDLSALEQACVDLVALHGGARARLLDEDIKVPTLPPIELGKRVEQLVKAPTSEERDALQRALEMLCRHIPLSLGEPLKNALEVLLELPATADIEAVSRRPKHDTALPDWLLPRRTIGSFYVVRALGAGGASSVFVARRIEARNQSNADHYALKVPKYDATVARSLSEHEFLEMFRQEAGALLALPKHPNLARFVNFDVEARPKPILVMELIAGNSLERAVRRRLLTTKSAFEYLFGILDGLTAMHQAGVGHLDLKPANVILRENTTAVLVDFGLSGRHIRPGCGTLEYCSPEILGVIAEGESANPSSADVYAFGCLAFETLTSKFLMDGPDETAIISGHVSHDGWPPRLAEFSRVDGMRDLAMLLARCIRKDPSKRPRAIDVRRALQLPAHDLESRPWPLPASREEAMTDSAPVPLVAQRR